MSATLPAWQQTTRDTAEARSYRPETVLVSVGGGSQSNAAISAARSMAELTGATLHYVYASPDQQQGASAEQCGLTPEQMRGAVLDQVTGEPVEAMMSIAQSLPAPLIVASIDTAADESQDASCPVAENVLNRAPAQVLLVPSDRGDTPLEIHRIVLAHDGAPSTDIAIALAAELAHRAKAEAIALHVASRKAPQPTEPGSLPAPRYIDQPQHEWPTWANEFVQRMMALGAPLSSMNFKLLVTGGQPGSEIAQFARENGADLVVLAWHGRWETERAGTLKVVVRRSGCPVLLVCVAPQCAPAQSQATEQQAS